MTEVPVLYKGNSKVIFYFNPEETKIPEIKFSTSLDTYPWEVALEEREGKVLAKFENVNRLFYDRSLSFVRNNHRDFLDGIRLEDIL